MEKSGNNIKIIIQSIVILLLGFTIGWIIKPATTDASLPAGEAHMHSEQGSTTWTCSMHPQIRQGEAGKCPICGMDLIPLDEQSEETDPREIRMSTTAMALANVQTQVVDFGAPVREIRLNGKVQPDERLIYSQVTHLGGRVEELAINFTGESVRTGQVIAKIYSPELVTAQEELFMAERIKETQPGLFIAAKEKLKNWKLTEDQIEKIVQSGETTESFAIVADVSGTVMEKKINLGDYIARGTPLYEIVNLSRVWVLFDVYESDMSWVKVGNQVEFTISSLPGETFHGRINFIDPTINPVTRVATARVEINNSTGKLKPEMFASGLIMTAAGNRKNQNLLVPKSAVMWTGPRSVVYEKREDDMGVTFQMKEVELGAKVGDNYIIKSGLDPGVEIAINGTFSIDAAAQLAGKPSMMNPSLGDQQVNFTKPLEINNKTKAALSNLFEIYFSLKDGLVADDFNSAKVASTNLEQALLGIDKNLFEGKAHESFMKIYDNIIKSLAMIKNAKDIVQAREAFKPLSQYFITLAKIFGPLAETIYIQHCPMADSNQGADWLSQEKQIQNPYFGSQMLKCGSVTEEIK